MKQFEVLVPERENLAQQRSVIVRARDSFSALHNAMVQLDETIDTSSLDCDFTDDGRMLATEFATGRVIEVRQHMPEAEQDTQDMERLDLQNSKRTAPLAATMELPSMTADLSENLSETKELPAISTAKSGKFQVPKPASPPPPAGSDAKDDPSGDSH